MGTGIRFVGIILLAFAVWATILFVAQHRLIYFPRAYQKETRTELAALSFRTDQGRQTAFYLPPTASAGKQVPRHLWLMLGGNAALALDWQYFAARFPDKSQGFLLFDYPGYGRCEGKASPDAIRQSLKAAITALAKHLGIEETSLRGRVSILGHSLGAAVALDFSLHFPPANLILLSPFTSMADMAKKAVGPPFHLLLRHRYDNLEALRLLVASPQKPKIVILHGANDEIIPVRMGRALAESQAASVEYHEFKGVDHNSIMAVAEPDLFKIMTRLTAAQEQGTSP